MAVQIARGYLHMAHRCGFTRPSLMQALLSAGFTRVGVRRGNFELAAVAMNGEATDQEVQLLIRRRLST